jgi:hypothetical protein
MTLIGSSRIATAELYGSEELSPIRTQGNVTALRARPVVFRAGATPRRRRSNASTYTFLTRHDWLDSNQEA